MGFSLKLLLLLSHPSGGEPKKKTVFFFRLDYRHVLVVVLMGDGETASTLFGHSETNWRTDDKDCLKDLYAPLRTRSKWPLFRPFPHSTTLLLPLPPSQSRVCVRVQVSLGVFIYRGIASDASTKNNLQRRITIFPLQT